MTELVQIPENFKKEFTVDAKGKITASVRGTARLADVNETGIRKSLKSGADLEPRPLAKYLIGYGFERAYLSRWIEDGIPGLAVNAILEYYGYECQPRYRKEQAKILCRAFRNYGYEKWFQQQLGWEPPKEPEEAMTPAEAFAKQAQIMLDHERRLKAQEEAQHDNLVVQKGHHQLLASLAGRVDKLSEGYVELMQHQIERKNELLESYLSQDEATKLTKRKIVWHAINQWCYVKDIEHKTGRNYFYTQLKLREGFDAKTRARNKGVQPIEVIEQEPGMMDKLHAIVSEKIREELAKNSDLELFFADFIDELLDAKPKEFVLVESSNHAELKDLAQKGQLQYDKENKQFYKLVD